MEVAVQCLCNAKFVLNQRFNSELSLACPNCGLQIPDNMAKHIKDLFLVRAELEKDNRDVTKANDGRTSYDITVSEFKI